MISHLLQELQYPSVQSFFFFLPLMKRHSKALQEEQLAAAAIFFRFLKRDEMT